MEYSLREIEKIESRAQIYGLFLGMVATSMVITLITALIIII